jgi:hypothetical protein
MVKMHRPGRQAVSFFARNRFGHGAPQPVLRGKSRPVVSSGWSGRFTLRQRRLSFNQNDLDFVLLFVL